MLNPNVVPAVKAVTETAAATTTTATSPAADFSRFGGLGFPEQSIPPAIGTQYVMAGGPDAKLQSDALRYHSMFLERSEQSIASRDIPEATKKVQLGVVQDERQKLDGIQAKIKSGVALEPGESIYVKQLITDYEAAQRRGGQAEGETAPTAPAAERRSTETPAAEVRPTRTTTSPTPAATPSPVNRPGIGIEVPSAERIMNSSIELLQGDMLRAEQRLTQFIDQNRGLLENLSLSGRGRQDLEKILSSKTGTYQMYGNTPGYLMVWTVDGRGVSSGNLMRELMAGADKAQTYSSLKNSSRTKVDSEPGGVMVLHPREIGKIGNHKNYDYGPEGQLIQGSGYTDDRRHIGEATVPLHSENFDQSYVGTVRFSSYAGYSNNLNALQEKMLQAYKTAEATTDPTTRTIQVGIYNANHPRAEMMSRAMSISILAEAFQMLQDQATKK